MNAGRVEDLTVHLTPGDARITRGAGVEYARALAGAPTGAFLEALAEQGGMIVRWAIGAGFGARQARTAAREFEAAARAEWHRIAAAGRGWRPRGAGMTRPSPEPFPGTLYAGDGTRLAGDGPEFSTEMTEHLPHKAVIRDRPSDEEVAVLEHGDRLWALPDTFGTPPELPVSLLAELADVVRRGHKVGLAAGDHEAYVLARDALVLLLDDTGGQA